MLTVRKLTQMLRKYWALYHTHHPLLSPTMSILRLTLTIQLRYLLLKPFEKPLGYNSRSFLVPTVLPMMSNQDDMTTEDFA